jgi:predicted TIM-barrel fold metal-dependent hydrolase
VVQTVFLECRSEYRTTGPEAMRPLGETVFVAAVAEKSAAGGGPPISGIVGHADLTLGAEVEEVLAAHVDAGSGLFRGIRDSAAWDPSDVVMAGRAGPMPHLYTDGRFREGFGRLSRFGLTFDAWNFHPQIAELTELARAFPETTIVQNHLGGPLGIGPYAGRREEVLSEWKGLITELAGCPNVTLKIGGLGMKVNGYGWIGRQSPATSDELVTAYQPWFDHALERFGPDRCLFESNFPVDRDSASYHVVWNAFKKLAAPLSDSEKEALLRGTAARVYRL